MPSQWPTLDVPPPLDSTFVKSLLAKVDLSNVPNIPLTGLNGCTNTTYNAQAIANAAQNGWWTCGQYTRATDVTSCPNTVRAPRRACFDAADGLWPVLGRRTVA